MRQIGQRTAASRIFFTLYYRDEIREEKVIYANIDYVDSELRAKQPNTQEKKLRIQ